jgi:ankyrin repeat protein
MLQLLLDKGADVSHRDCRGASALHVAALWGHEDAVTLLLQTPGCPDANNMVRFSLPKVLYFQWLTNNFRMRLAIPLCTRRRSAANQAC